MKFGVTDILIVFYLWVAWAWSLPEDSAARRMIAPLNRLIQWLGLWHDWRMFAPNPIRRNQRVIVRVDYSDGTRREWQPPVAGEVGWWRGFLFSRVRKFTEHVARGKPQGLPISLAFFVMLRLSQMDLQGATPVVAEILEETWPTLPDPAHPVEKKYRVVYREELAPRSPQ